MNRKMIFYTVGHIALAESALLLLPALIALIYLEKSGVFFLLLNLNQEIFIQLVPVQQKQIMNRIYLKRKK